LDEATDVGVALGEGISTTCSQTEHSLSAPKESRQIGTAQGGSFSVT
jgi:hypothetical protein